MKEKRSSTLGKKFKMAREARELTRLEVANLLGWSESKLARLERSQQFSIEDFLFLSNIYGLDTLGLLHRMNEEVVYRLGERARSHAVKGRVKEKVDHLL